MKLIKISEQDKKIYRHIKSLMILRGVKQADIARKLRVSQSAISQTLMRKIDSKRIKRGIARALKEPIDKLWPNSNGKS